ncbi:MAG TPA: hypothetical protein VH105_09255 [Burkholderiales bacterium]|nr:hypothetical protein [Burkholderiales bacterium]
MEPTAPAAVLHHPESGYFSKVESAVSGVSWAAVAGGAFVAAAMALILLAFGAGLGLTSVSPWANTGASVAAVGIATVIWLVLMQVISSAMGGYVAGRLRTKWVDVHSDEVYFRDTAHGFLVWAVGLVIAAAFLGSAASSLVGTAAELGGAAAGTAAAGAGAAVAEKAAGGNSGTGNAMADGSDPTGYFVDSLFRIPRGASPAPAAAAVPAPGAAVAPGVANDPNPSAGGQAPAVQPPPAGVDPARTYWASEESQNAGPRGADMGARVEAGRILLHDLAMEQFPANDRAYLVQMVAARTGMSAADADRRVGEVLANAQQVKTAVLEKTDQARHTAAELAFWTFFAMLAGAFAASFSATIGGRQRDAALARA